MNEGKEQMTAVTQHKGPDDFANARETILRDWKYSLTSVIDRVAKNRIELVKDYANIGMLAIGAMITILTVKPDLIKTPALAVTGCVIVMTSVFISFIARLYYIRDQESIISEVEGKFAAGMSTVTSARTAADIMQAFENLKPIDILIEYKSSAPMIFQKADVYNGMIVLIGVVFIAISLTLSIDVHIASLLTL